MHREDNSLFLLYIEPKKEERSMHPVEDMLTKCMEIALEESISGHADYSNLESHGRFYFGSGYMGFHETDCGEWSSSNDYLLKSGNITNYLATFYLRWYRNSIPATDMKKMGDVLYAYHRDLPYDRDEIYAKIKELRGYEV